MRESAYVGNVCVYVVCACVRARARAREREKLGGVFWCVCGVCVSRWVCVREKVCVGSRGMRVWVRKCVCVRESEGV